MKFFLTFLMVFHLQGAAAYIQCDESNQKMEIGATDSKQKKYRLLQE